MLYTRSQCMGELRLGDIIDDFCVKCRRLTNHAIVSLMNGAAAKVRCRTCYSDHDFRNEQAPPTKKELARQKELYNAVLSGAGIPAVEGAPALDGVAAVDGVLPEGIDLVADAAAIDAAPSEPAPDEAVTAKPAVKKKAARSKK